MSSLAWHSASQSASGKVNARIPRNPSSASASCISRLQRTDLLASLIGVPAARRARSAAFDRKATRSTIANGGEVPRPYVVQRVVGPDGSVVSTTRSQMLGRAIKEQTASELTQMMVSVVQAGTGTAAQIPGIQVAGKTGTAETNVTHVYNAWFVCFAPADNPRVAVAVVVEKQPTGFGGSLAAPIAKALMETLLSG